jgi:hypothetical protein
MVNLGEGPSTITIKVCAGCKSFRLGVDNGGAVGLCYHISLEWIPQVTFGEDGELPYLTPDWCPIMRTRSNENKLREGF